MIKMGWCRQPCESLPLEFISYSESVGPRRADILDGRRGHNSLMLWREHIFYIPNVNRLAS